MPDRKLSELTPLTSITNTTSYFHIVDTDEASPADQNKTITYSILVSELDSSLSLSSGLFAVSSNDTTPGFGIVKIVPGSSGDISITEINDGGNETLEIEFAGSTGEDYFVSNTANPLPTATGTDSIAVGYSANANALDCFQIGPGTNTLDSSLQYTSKTIAIAQEGIVADYFSGTPVTTFYDGAIKVSDNDEFYFQSNGSWFAVQPGVFPIDFQDESVTILSGPDTVDFQGTGVTVTSGGPGNITVTIPGNSIITQDEGSTVDSTATTLNFVGAGVTASDAGGNITTVTIPGGSVNTFKATIGDGAATTFTVNHALGTRDVFVYVYRNVAPYEQVFPGIEHTDANNTEIVFTPTVPASNEYRVLIQEVT